MLLYTDTHTILKNIILELKNTHLKNIHTLTKITKRKNTDEARTAYKNFKNPTSKVSIILATTRRVSEYRLNTAAGNPVTATTNVHITDAARVRPLN